MYPDDLQDELIMGNVSPEDAIKEVVKVIIRATE